MKIEFRHGPKDGKMKFLPLGRLSDTIIVDVAGVDYLYRRTERMSRDGYTIYQFVSIVAEFAA